MTDRPHVISGTKFALKNKRFDAGNVSDEQAMREAESGGVQALVIVGSEGKMERSLISDSTDHNNMTVEHSDVVFYRCIFAGRRGGYVLNENRWIRGLALVNYSRVTYRECLFIDFDIRGVDAASSRIDMLNCLHIRTHWQTAFWNMCRGNVIGNWFEYRGAASNIVQRPIGILRTEDGWISQGTVQGRYYAEGNRDDPFCYINEGQTLLRTEHQRAYPWSHPYTLVDSATARTRVLLYAGPYPRNQYERDVIARAA